MDSSFPLWLITFISPARARQEPPKRIFSVDRSIGRARLLYTNDMKWRCKVVLGTRVGPFPIYCDALEVGPSVFQDSIWAIDETVDLCQADS